MEISHAPVIALLGTDLKDMETHSIGSWPLSVPCSINYNSQDMDSTKILTPK